MNVLECNHTAVVDNELWLSFSNFLHDSNNDYNNSLENQCCYDNSDVSCSASYEWLSDSYNTDSSQQNINNHNNNSTELCHTAETTHKSQSSPVHAPTSHVTRSTSASTLPRPPDLQPSTPQPLADPSPTTVRRRRRKVTVKQRIEANDRERRRMTQLNTAFNTLRSRVPVHAYERRPSRIDTLRLATDYIAFMVDCLSHTKRSLAQDNNVPF